ncbi:hypothetical protein PV327_005514 [Microctonus hyperodae]|uniref:Nuclear speckle splicing regulatory protein 1 N-terminal domain-containing protein n=1 Tax=Microctonus hyperodae TaxID=165561 RepID=A0AA39G1Y7_MICHY|nr:hypothetical protein PV327_005514 [Microctonus hyperodae]
MNTSGKQYGLIMPKKAQISAPKAGNIFGDDHDSDTEDGMDWVKKSLKAEGEKSRMKKQTKLDMQRALDEDPTIYQYDEIYDEMEKKEEQSKVEKKKEMKKPKYIHHLLKAADRRKREQEHRIERMVQKEREAEGEMFADKESFVTSAYKAKLEEFKKMEEEEERMDRLESIGDVTKQQDISGFYRQLFAQTVDAAKKNDDDNNEEIHSETLAQSSKMDEDDKSSSESATSSEADTASDHEDERKNVSRITLKAKKSRQYRQRVIETSDVESEPDDNQSNKDLSENLVDNDNTVNEECESPKKKVKLSTEEKEESPCSKDMNNEPDADEVFKVPECGSAKKENLNENVANVEKPKPPEKKISIWEKRTVGPVFEAALQRYYNRKAMRMSGN